MFVCIPPPQVNVHFVHSGSPGHRIVLQALVTAVLFTHVTCSPPPQVFVHSVQQVLPVDAVELLAAQQSMNTKRNVNVIMAKVSLKKLINLTPEVHNNCI